MEFIAKQISIEFITYLYSPQLNITIIVILNYHT